MDTSLHVCSVVEQKVDQLSETVAEHSRQQLERESTVVEYLRCIHVCHMCTLLYIIVRT